MSLSKILQRSLAIKTGEKVLIVTDKKEMKLAKKFFSAAKKLSKDTFLLTKPVGNHHGEEPSAAVAKAMRESNVVIAITTHSLTHTKARKNASKAGTRIASLPTFNEKMFTTLQANPFLLQKAGRKIINVLKKAKRIRIITKSGTNVSFSIQNRKLDNDDGLYRKKGTFGNLPAGEVSLAPVEGTANGIIVIDSMRDDKEVFATRGTAVTVKKGLATEISDKKYKLAKYFLTIKNSRNIAELGIGTNPKAKLIGNILQDEKVKGTCHIAFGNNKSFGGKVYSTVHIDAILLKPTIFADSKMIMKKGKLLI